VKYGARAIFADLAAPAQVAVPHAAQSRSTRIAVPAATVQSDLSEPRKSGLWEWLKAAF
jgi:hypothetical protein